MQQQGVRRKTLTSVLSATKQDQPKPNNPSPHATVSTPPTTTEEEDDAKLSADQEFRTLAMNLAAKEQREYCDK
jgi:hypothetical protein